MEEKLKTMYYAEQRKLAVKLFRNEKYEELRKAIKNGKCFSELMPIAEKAGAIEYWNKFPDEWKYEAGCFWKNVTDEIRIKEFPTLDDIWKYWAGRNWKGITDEMRRKEFPTFDDEYKYKAGRDWSGITKEMRVEEVILKI